MSLALGSISLLIAAAGALVVPPSTTAEIVTDGKIRGPEWADAKSVTLAEGVSILVKADGDNVAIAVRNSARGPQYTDLFVAGEDGQVWNLHASMQVGERKLSGTAWTDNDPIFVWGNNANWSANEVAVKGKAISNTDAPLVEKLKPFDGQEFLIARKQFPGKVWHVRVEVRDFMSEKPDLVHPKASTRYDPTTWAELELP